MKAQQGKRLLYLEDFLIREYIERYTLLHFEWSNYSLSGNTGVCLFPNTERKEKKALIVILLYNIFPSPHSQHHSCSYLCHLMFRHNVFQSPKWFCDGVMDHLYCEPVNLMENILELMFFSGCLNHYYYSMLDQFSLTRCLIWQTFICHCGPCSYWRKVDSYYIRGSTE